MLPIKGNLRNLRRSLTMAILKRFVNPYPHPDEVWHVNRVPSFTGPTHIWWEGSLRCLEFQVDATLAYQFFLRPPPDYPVLPHAADTGVSYQGLPSHAQPLFTPYYAPGYVGYVAPAGDFRGLRWSDTGRPDISYLWGMVQLATKYANSVPGSSGLGPFSNSLDGSRLYLAFPLDRLWAPSVQTPAEVSAAIATYRNWVPAQSTVQIEEDHGWPLQGRALLCYQWMHVYFVAIELVNAAFTYHYQAADIPHFAVSGLRWEVAPHGVTLPGAWYTTNLPEHKPERFYG